jgi:hypothetical protein
MTVQTFLGRLSAGSIGCVFGTICFGMLVLIIPALDVLMPKTTLSGHPNRLSLARDDIRIFGRYCGSFALATFSFAKRDRLNSEIH